MKPPLTAAEAAALLKLPNAKAFREFRIRHRIPNRSLPGSNRVLVSEEDCLRAMPRPTSVPSLEEVKEDGRRAARDDHRRHRSRFSF
jgi:hypothetical protein